MDAALKAFAGSFGWATPFAITVVAVALIFRTSVRGLLDRLKSFSFGGHKAEMTEPQQQQVEKVEPQLLPDPAAGRPERPPPTTPMYEAVEQDMRTRLEKTAPNDVEVQLSWAIRVAANAMIDRDMEVTYRIIFGSQIAALKEANLRGGSIAVVRAQEIYEQAKARHPDLYEALSFEAWAEFPITRGLASRPDEPITPESRSNLTEAGKQFLLFLTAKGLFEGKHG